MKQLFNHSKIANRVIKRQQHIQFVRLADIMGKRELCDECKALGYCMLNDIKEIRNPEEFVRFTVKDYLNLVSVQIYGGQFGQYSKFHLQVACDAFHQEDYETAILHFRAALEAGNFYDAIIGLAVAYFMAKDYENAAIFAARCSTSYTAAIIESLKDDIAKLAIENATVKEEVIAETSINAIEKQANKLALVY